MLKSSPKRLLGLIILLILAVSLIANAFIFRSAWRLHKETNSIRLNPLGLSYYPPEEQQPVAKEAGQQVVVFYGDSRAVQWPFPKGPEITADFVFINRGIDTQTSSQVAERFEAHIRPLQPDIIVLQMCINDLKTIPLFPDARTDIIDNCKNNIQEIVTKSRAIDATLILTTVFPFGPLPPDWRLIWSDDVFYSVDEVNDFIQSLAGEGVIVFDAYSVLADENGIVKEGYRYDFLHVNGPAYDALNEPLAEILNLVE